MTELMTVLPPLVVAAAIVAAAALGIHRFIRASKAAPGD
jgi:type II secretory pathway component PulK